MPALVALPQPLVRRALLGPLPGGGGPLLQALARVADEVGTAEMADPTLGPAVQAFRGGSHAAAVVAEAEGGGGGSWFQSATGGLMDYFGAKPGGDDAARRLQDRRRTAERVVLFEEVVKSTAAVCLELALSSPAQ